MLNWTCMAWDSVVNNLEAADGTCDIAVNVSTDAEWWEVWLLWARLQSCFGLGSALVALLLLQGTCV